MSWNRRGPLPYQRFYGYVEGDREPRVFKSKAEREKWLSEDRDKHKKLDANNTFVYRWKYAQKVMKRP